MPFCQNVHWRQDISFINNAHHSTLSLLFLPLSITDMRTVNNQLSASFDQVPLRTWRNLHLFAKISVCQNVHWRQNVSFIKKCTPLYSLPSLPSTSNHGHYNSEQPTFGILWSGASSNMEKFESFRQNFSVSAKMCFTLVFGKKSGILRRKALIAFSC